MTDKNRNWISVAISADGSKLVAVEDAGHIYTGNIIPPAPKLPISKVPVEPPLLSISIMSSLTNQQSDTNIIGGYKQKYLKYKQKYLQLKNGLN
jgi:hypothetical protein